MYPPGGASVSFRVRVYCWRGQDILEPGGRVSRGQQKTHIKRDLRSQPEVPSSDRRQAVGGPSSLAPEGFGRFRVDQDYEQPPVLKGEGGALVSR